MQLSFDESKIENICKAPALQPFAEEVIAFLNDLSAKLMRTGRMYSDVVTFAYWCRKAAVLSYKKEYSLLERRLGRGVVFHIAPSNVPVNFAFSLAAGLLAGNKNIVRLPSKDFPQVTIICDAIEAVIEQKYPNMYNYVYLLRYERGSDITTKISAVADTRVIWGGDNTIAEIRKSPLKPRATEITFADRHSICVISSEAYNSSDEKEKLIQRFYNDTYFTDQNACTSPRIVVWLGKEIEVAKKDFWEKVQKKAEEEYHIEPVQIVGKLSALYEVAAKTEVTLQTEMKQTKLMVLEVEKIHERLMDYKYNSGFFYEYQASKVEEILPLCDNRCQTISYYGEIADEICQAILKQGDTGVDRIVPIGETMDFSLIWDGYDLITSMSRMISVR